LLELELLKLLRHRLLAHMPLALELLLFHQDQQVLFF
jgi:hypothetical protein